MCFISWFLLWLSFRFGLRFFNFVDSYAGLPFFVRGFVGWGRASYFEVTRKQKKKKRTMFYYMIQRLMYVDYCTERNWYRGYFAHLVSLL